MPRVHHRKARKDYPNQGIAKGDMYYTAKIKTGPASGYTIRSKTPLKPSQLSRSPFKSGWMAMNEAWDESSKDGEAIRAAAEAIRELGEEAGNSFDNMPEGLQQGETGQMLETRRDESESKADELDQLADEYDELEEPTEPDEVEEPDDPDSPEYAAFEEYQDALSEYEDAVSEYEQEQERIRDEAESLIQDMPEY